MSDAIPPLPPEAALAANGGRPFLCILDKARGLIALRHTPTGATFNLSPPAYVVNPVAKKALEDDLLMAMMRMDAGIVHAQSSAASTPPTLRLAGCDAEAPSDEAVTLQALADTLKEHTHALLVFLADPAIDVEPGTSIDALEAIAPHLGLTKFQVHGAVNWMRGSRLITTAIPDGIALHRLTDRARALLTRLKDSATPLPRVTGECVLCGTVPDAEGRCRCRGQQPSGI